MLTIVLLLALSPALAAAGPTTAPDAAGPAVAPPPAASAGAGMAELEDLQNAFADIAERIAPSVVAVQGNRRLSAIKGLTPEQKEMAEKHGDRLVPAVGSGIIIDASGLVLTNDHVVDSLQDVTVVLSNRHRYNAKVLASDPRSDLAVIQIVNGGDHPEFEPATFGDLSNVRQGHWAIAMGNAFGLANEGRPAMTVGVISAIGRSLPAMPDTGDRYYGNMIQTSADINPGNSGGPLLNIRGQVIGVNTAISSRTGFSEGVGFAIPITGRTRAIIALLRQGRKVEYGFLGVSVRSPGPAESARVGAPAYVGALVVAVEPDTPAARGGVQEGDIIVRIDGQTIEDYSHLVRAIGGSPIDRPIEVALWRGGKQATIKVTLAKRDEVMARRPEDPIWCDWRGARVVDLSAQRRETLGLAADARGVAVVSVEDGSAAQAAGLRPGEVIDQLDKQAVGSLSQFQQVSESLDAAADVQARIVNGEPKLKLVKGKKQQP
ncbi:MAG: hypothetical protein BIFFINMI_01240 [Phycisphaerae bacterium]|nr:hypothetical protein [Phycisphaerae bacterium]